MNIINDNQIDKLKNDAVCVSVSLSNTRYMRIYTYIFN